MLISRLLLALLLLLPLIAGGNNKQTLLNEDRLRIRAYVEPEQRFYVGQQVRFYVEILTDSWFTIAPAYPEVRVPGAVAIDPERFSTNLTVSEGGRTYSGQRHGYLVYPQRVGSLTIPAVSVSFAAAIDAKPSQTITLTTQPVKIEAVMPPGVENAVGLITATNVKLSEQLQPTKLELKVGDSIQRSVTVSADDIQALVLPPIEFAAVEGLAAYPGEPELRNQTNRGQYKATRTDTVTYIVEQAGEYTLPSIALQWFDPESGRLRKPALPEQSFTAQPDPNALTGVPVVSEPLSDGFDIEALTGQVLEWLADNLRFISLGVGLLYFFSLLNRRYRLTLVERWQQRRAAARVSEQKFFHDLEKACRSDNAAEVVNAFWRWVTVGGFRRVDVEQLLSSTAHDAKFAGDWQALNRCLYAPDKTSEKPALRSLLPGFRHMRQTLQAQKSSPRTPLVWGSGALNP